MILLKVNINKGETGDKKMLIEEIIIIAFIGALTSTAISFYSTKGKADGIVIFMTLFGASIGWIIGMIFIFATGGLELTFEWLLLPVITTALLTVYMLYKFQDKRLIVFSNREKTNTAAMILSIIILIALLGGAAAMSLPKTYTSAASIDYLSTSESVRLISGSKTYELSGSDAYDISTPLSSNGISVGFTKSSVNFPRIAENPMEGDYLEFQATFTVSQNNWVSPYIKMTVIYDADGSGTLSSGDQYWSDVDFKFATQSGKKWRTNLIWENNAPYIQIHQVSTGDNILILPIVHANTITQWKNDEGNSFMNTPENYNSPYDQLSWELIGSSINLKEDVSAFATINTGSSESIKGKIYCPTDSAGQHFLIIQAFDFNYHDPWDPDETPFAQEYMTFVVTEEDDHYCGDGNCDPDENPTTCPQDCDPDDPYCGDGNCDSGENQYNCPEDCGSPGQPDVDITTSSWVVTIALFGFLGVGGVGALIYTPRFLFGKGGKKI